MKLLIVDAKDPAELEALRAQLEADGDVVLQAKDAAEARAMLDALRKAGGDTEPSTMGQSERNAIPPRDAVDGDSDERLVRLERVHAEALDRLRNLEARLGQCTAAAELANRDLQSLSYSVSHDLRAPLRAIGGFTDIVLRDHGGAIPPDAIHLLERVVANAKRMNQLIDKLLEFTRVGLSALNIQPINVSRLVRECLHALDAERPEGRTKISIGDLPSCRADLLLLKQVLLHLLENALKFSAKRELSRIDVGAEVRNGEFIYHVRDNGVGFDMRMAHKLFQVFQRLHAQRDFDGTGIGLAIVRRVIERHGGRVWADSTLDAGAIFSFALPTDGPAEALER